MKQRTEILGGHAFFFPDGAKIGGAAQNLASRTNKPSADDPAWFNLGLVDIKFQPQREEHEVWGPSPGRKRLHDIISFKRGLDFGIHVKEQSNLLWQIFLGTDTLPNSPAAGGQFNPLEGADVKGWLKVQFYGRDDDHLMTIDAFVYLKAGGDLDPGDGPAEADITGRLLHSPLNTGELK